MPRTSGLLLNVNSIFFFSYLIYSRGELCSCWYVLLCGSVFIDGSMYLPGARYVHCHFEFSRLLFLFRDIAAGTVIHAVVGRLPRPLITKRHSDDESIRSFGNFWT